VAKIDVNVPDIGDFKDVPVIEVLVKPGDVVKVDQSLITLESDKATMDVPSPVAGTVAEVVAKVGDKVSMGTLVARMEDAAGATAAEGSGASPKAGAGAAPAAPPKKAATSETTAAPAEGALIDVAIPDIGDFTEVPVIEVLVRPGDTVEAEQPLVTLESDKATMDVPSPAAGKITEITVKVGDKVSMGSRIAKLDAGRQGAPRSPGQADEADAKEEEDAAEAPDTSPVAPTDLPPRPSQAAASPALPDFAGVFAGPAVRRLARELGLDLNQIKGTGQKGRITRDDVKSAVARGGAAGGAVAGGGAALPAVPTVDFAKFGPIETVPLSRIKKISGPRLHASWVNLPHVTHFDEADITDLDAFRKALDEDAKKDKSKPYRVSLLPLLMRAAVATLKTFPTFNAALNPAGDSLILRRYWHIGVAVDTPDGLVVAVVKDVDQKGVIELARELGALSEKARAGKLAPTEMQGATFTISSLGGIGGSAFTPIVNAPEVAILGVVRSKMAPVWDGTAFQPRLMLPLCLSYDHRVIDGAAGARFMRHLAGLLEDMRRMIL